MKKLIVITSPHFFKGEDPSFYICLMKGCNVFICVNRIAMQMNYASC